MVLQELAAVEEGGIEALWWEKKWGAQFYRGDMANRRLTWAVVRLLPHKHTVGYGISLVGPAAPLAVRPMHG